MIDLPLEIQIHIATCTNDIEIFRTCLLLSKPFSTFVKERVEWFKKYFNHRKVITLLRNSKSRPIIPLVNWLPKYAIGKNMLFRFFLPSITSSIYRKSYHDTHDLYTTSPNQDLPSIELYTITEDNHVKPIHHIWGGNRTVLYISFYPSGQIAYIQYQHRWHAKIPDLPCYKYITDHYNEKGEIEMNENDKQKFIKTDFQFQFYRNSYNIMRIADGAPGFGEYWRT